MKGIGINDGFSEVEKALDEHRIYASLTKGVSMRPLLRTHKDTVIVEKCSSPLQKYDVALYKVGENYVLHRVVGIDKKRCEYLIRGDNTYRLERVPFTAIVGRLTAFVRSGRYKTVEAVSYKIYSRIWTFLYPLRFLCHIPKSIAFRIKRAFSRKKI